MTRMAIVLGSIVAVLLAAGCGKHADEQAAGQVATTQPASFEPTAATSGAGFEGPPALDASPAESRGTVSADSLAPDVSVSAPDTLVSPGSPVEIVARGTPDVVGVVVWDGIGQKQPMTYDADAKVWRAFYRVPLRTSGDRVALSVTAKNAASKWRRVWVSLMIQREATEARPEPASGH